MLLTIAAIVMPPMSVAAIEPTTGASTPGEVIAPERAEEADVRLSHTNNWWKAPHASFSGGAYMAASQPNSTLTGWFTGDGLTIIGAKSARYGRFEVLVDGSSCGVVDCYSPTTAYSVPVFARSGLPWGEHTFALRVLGSKSSASAGYSVLLDAIDVQGGLIEPSGLSTQDFGAVAEESDPRISWMGLWKTSLVSAASGGRVRHAAVIGSAADVSFEGTSVAWYGPMGPLYGRAEVIVDGVSQGFVEQYAPTLSQGNLVWGVTGLAEGEHQLRVRATGQKSPASTGATVVIDRIAAQAFSLPHYDEHDGRTAVVGDWAAQESESARDGVFITSSSRDAHVVVRFTGTAFRWIGPKGPAFGKAEVHLDGRLVGVVDQYAMDDLESATVWAVGGLADTGHAVVIRVLDDARPDATGSQVGFDCAETARGMFGAVAAWAPDDVALNECDGRFVYIGSWSQVAAPGFAGGAFKVAGTAGATLTSAFRGTGFSVLGAKGPAYGQAEVFVDGASQGVIDCYSPDEALGTTIFSAKGLADAVHVVSVRVLGSKCETSACTSVAVDGIVVAGQPLRVLDDRASAVTHSASWESKVVTPAVTSAVHRSGVTGATAVLRFIGTSVAVIAPRGPAFGRAQVLIDGVSRGTVDLYAPDAEHQRAVFSATLADAAHTVVVKALGTRNAASSSAAIAVDGFAVTGERVTRRGVMVATSKAQLNKQYVWAGSGPTVFDCSGLTSYAYRTGGIGIPHQSGYQFRMCSPQSLSWMWLLPGDLVFTSTPSYIHHVGIYVGWGLTINAPGTGRFVEYRAADTYGCFGRIAAKYWPGGYNGP